MTRGYRVAQTLACACILVMSVRGRLYAEPSLAGVFGPAPAKTRHADAQTDALLEQLGAIERRAYASDTQVQRALGQAREQLALLRTAMAQAAPQTVLQRYQTLIWAALSWADRAEARARTAAALAGLAARAADAEAAAQRARAAVDRARESETAR